MIDQQDLPYIEVPREGRRPRYHRMQADATGEAMLPRQCALPQLAQPYRVLLHLPPIRRPKSQLCRRCFSGSPLLEQAS